MINGNWKRFIDHEDLDDIERLLNLGKCRKGILKIKGFEILCFFPKDSKKAGNTRRISNISKKYF